MATGATLPPPPAGDRPVVCPSAVPLRLLPVVSSLPVLSGRTAAGPSVAPVVSDTGAVWRGCRSVRRVGASVRRQADSPARRFTPCGDTDGSAAGGNDAVATDGPARCDAPVVARARPDRWRGSVRGPLLRFERRGPAGTHRRWRRVSVSRPRLAVDRRVRAGLAVAARGHADCDERARPAAARRLRPRAGVGVRATAAAAAGGADTRWARRARDLAGRAQQRAPRLEHLARDARRRTRHRAQLQAADPVRGRGAHRRRRPADPARVAALLPRRRRQADRGPAPQA